MEEFVRWRLQNMNYMLLQYYDIIKHYIKQYNYVFV